MRKKSIILALIILIIISMHGCKKYPDKTNLTGIENYSIADATENHTVNKGYYI